MSNPKLFFIGVKALVRRDDGRILLLKADTKNHSKNTRPYWDLPGGRIEENETPDQTLIREVAEETGIKVDFGVKFITSVVSNHEIPKGDRILGLALMVYEVEIADSTQE